MGILVKGEYTQKRTKVNPNNLANTLHSHITFVYLLSFSPPWSWINLSKSELIFESPLASSPPSVWWSDCLRVHIPNWLSSAVSSLSRSQTHCRTPSVFVSHRKEVAYRVQDKSENLLSLPFSLNFFLHWPLWYQFCLSIIYLQQLLSMLFDDLFH